MTSDMELMYFSVWNDVVDLSEIQIEDRVVVTFRIKTKMEKGKTSTYLNAENVALT